MATNDNSAEMSWTCDEDKLLLSLLNSTNTNGSCRGSLLTWPKIAFEMNKQTLSYLAGTRIYTAANIEEHYIEILEPKLVQDQEQAAQRASSTTGYNGFNSPAPLPPLNTPAAERRFDNSSPNIAPLEAADASAAGRRRGSLPPLRGHFAQITPSFGIDEPIQATGPPVSLEEYQNQERRASSSRK